MRLPASSSVNARSDASMLSNELLNAASACLLPRAGCLGRVGSSAAWGVAGSGAPKARKSASFAANTSPRLPMSPLFAARTSSSVKTSASASSRLAFCWLITLAMSRPVARFASSALITRSCGEGMNRPSLLTSSACWSVYSIPEFSTMYSISAVFASCRLDSARRFASSPASALFGSSGPNCSPSTSAKN